MYYYFHFLFDKARRRYICQKKRDEVSSNVFFQGKQERQSLMAVDNCCSTIPGRLLVTDRASKLQFLVDTGTDLYVYPLKSYKYAPTQKS